MTNVVVKKLVGLSNVRHLGEGQAQLARENIRFGLKVLVWRFVWS
jgi:hypothetical protein